MSYILKVENERGSILNLSEDETKYQITNISGLNPVNANINTSDIAGVDGAAFNSSKLQSRNIVITIKINGDVERNRLLLYQFFSVKQKCKLYYKNNSRNVFINGHTETFEVEHFSQSQKAQISIICPQPYLKDMEIIIDDISKIIPKFEFSFSINIDEAIEISTIEKDLSKKITNNSECETGLIIKAVFSGKVSKLEIKNIETGEYFIFNYDFVEDDILKVDCNKGSKSAILTRNGKEINLMPHRQRGSKFFQLKIGDNYFSYLADEGVNDHLVDIKFSHYNVYTGV